VLNQAEKEVLCAWVMKDESSLAQVVYQEGDEQIYAKEEISPALPIFFTRQWDTVPPYVIHCIIGSQIIYEQNVFISIIITDEPFGVATSTGRVSGRDWTYWKSRSAIWRLST